MNLAELIEGLEGPAGVRVERGDPARTRVCDITEDSRTAVPGSLFVARPGQRHDGRAHIAAALECGAVAVLTDRTTHPPIDLPARSPACILTAPDVARTSAALAERFYELPSSRLVIAAVTGTNGKTTVAHLIHHLLNHAGARCGMIGTVDIDDGREVAPASMTTPPAIEISRTLASMVEHGCQACAMEASSHALDQGRTAGLTIDVAIFTNLSGDHQDYHGSMEAYAAAKRRLFEDLPEDAVRLANVDDAHASAVAGAGAIACSVRPSDGWRVEARDASIEGMGLRVWGPAYEIESQTGLVGAHNAMNALQAIAAADAVLTKLGVDADARRDALAGAMPSMRAPRGRLQVVREHETGPAVLVDFAHTDGALRAALTSARAIVPKGGRLWAVFGCGGVKDTTKRPRMGAVAAELADEVVVTSDNPRTERPDAIVRDVLAGMTPEQRDRAHVHVDRERAIRCAVEGAGPRDLIVLAGKGHETDQEVASPDGSTVRRPFDDVQIATALLRETRLRRASEAAPA